MNQDPIRLDIVNTSTRLKEFEIVTGRTRTLQGAPNRRRPLSSRFWDFDMDEAVLVMNALYLYEIRTDVLESKTRKVESYG